MPTTFNWISLGIPRNILGTPVLIDPLETVAGAENANGLLTAQNNAGPRVFGSQDSPLYSNITSATMINRSGVATTLETDTAIGSPADQFSTNVGTGNQTFNFDAVVAYTGTVTYADGSTASNVQLLLVQAESGELFLAPPSTAAGANAALTVKPITSIQLDGAGSTTSNLAIDRQLGVFDDGFVDGTAGNDSIVGGYVEPGIGGSDQVDGGDGLTSPGTGFNDDRIRAGAGNDTIDGGSGADLINAGDGDDLINLTGAFGNDTLTGGVGSDTLSGATLTGPSTVTFNGGTGTFANGGSTASFNTTEAVTTGAGADTVNISGTTAGTFVTGAGADTINAGGSGADLINAGDGDDLINLTGAFGNDTLTGGVGSDTLSGATLTGPSTVTFNGGTGTFANGGSTASFNTTEAVTTGAGADTVNISGTTAGTFVTGAGADTINAGGSGADLINAGDGDDLINLTGAFGNDTLTGGVGSDTLSGATLTGPSTVTFNGGTGTFANGGSTASFNTTEAVTTGAGADTVNASSNTTAASFNLGAGNDSFIGGLGAETVNGGEGDDVITSSGGADVISAGDGQDLVDAGDGDDFVDAGSGNDTVEGGAGNDTILGSVGDDQLSGGAGNDSLLGGVGNDVLLGGDGDDYLEGGAGADTLTGGAGNDVFVATSGDLITDFTTGDPANNDSFDLTNFYNDANLAIINAQRETAGLPSYNSALGWLKSDQADDGVLNSIRIDAGFSENFTLRIENGGTAVSATALTEGTTAVVCFGSDALIETANGPVAAGALEIGDKVLTRDNGYQPIRWIGQRVLDENTLRERPALTPIRIRAGALGRGLPTSDLIVSPQHRILVRSQIAERMFGTREVLVAAKQLLVSEGIDIANDMTQITYVHFLFDDHQIVVSNGAETESLYTGEEALKSVSPEARAEIMALFPELEKCNAVTAARPLLSGRMGRKLAQRHAQNRKALVA